MSDGREERQYGRGIGPFLGRDSEVAELHAGLSDACAGRGRLFLVTGEAGIGKTRFADEVATAAGRRGMSVLWGRCWESGGAPAYWPWVQVLRAYARQADPATVAARLRAAPDVLYLVPELRPEGLALPSRKSVESDEERFRVLDAVAAFLRRAAAERPLAILLDDLHTADHSSLLLLRFLAYELPSAPILVFGAYREREAAERGFAADLLGDLLREGRRIPLRGLSSAAVAKYVAVVAQHRIAAGTVDAIYGLTEGHPLFLTEVMRSYAAESARRGWDGAVDFLAVPEELRAVIRRRLALLPRDVVRALAVGAVLGRAFDPVVVGRLLEPPGGAAVGLPAAVHDLMDAARRAGLVQSQPGGCGNLSFEHVLIRDVLYDDLPAGERMTLHRAAAQALETIYAADLSPCVAEIAHHYAQAVIVGDACVDKAVEFARLAGDRAGSLFAFEDAVQHYESGLQLLTLRRSGPIPADLESRCRLLLLAGDALWGTGDLARMRETFRDAAMAARTLPGEAGAALLARAALGYAGRQHTAHLRFDSVAVQLLEDAIAALPDGDSPLRAQLLAHLAYALYTQPRSYPRRAELCSRAAEMARRIGDPHTLRSVFEERRWAMWGPDAIHDRVRIAAELTHLAQQMGDRELTLFEHAWRLTDFLELGDIVGVNAELATYTRLANEHPGSWYYWNACHFGTMLALLQGRFAEAEHLAGEMLAARKKTREYELLLYGSQMLALRCEQGRLAEIEPAMLALVEQHADIPIWPYIVAYIHTELDRPAEARAALERLAAHDFNDLPANYLRLPAAAYAAEVCTFLGDRARAARLYELLLPYASLCVVIEHSVVCLGSAERYLGMLAGTIARPEAAAHFEAALAVNARLGARPAVARTQYAFAHMILTGAAPPNAAERAQAAQLLRAAQATATELDMRVLRTRSAGLAPRADPEPAPVHPSADTSTRAAAAACDFRRDGDCWLIGPPGGRVRVKHLRGFIYLEHLLSRPGIEVHVFDLVDLAAGAGGDRQAPRRRDAGPARPRIDTSVRAAARERLRELRAELAEAEAANDLGHIQRYREEITALGEQLAAAGELGGRRHRDASQADRARIAVSKAIRVALAQVARHNPDLARHLRLVVRTGMFCAYRPDPLHPLAWNRD